MQPTVNNFFIYNTLHAKTINYYFKKVTLKKNFKKHYTIKISNNNVISKKIRLSIYNVSKKKIIEIIKYG